jgi:predicted DNA-binding WGR domain protein
MTTTRRFEFTDAKSNKFWEITVTGKKVTVQFGRIGTDGQAQTKAYATPSAAKMAVEKQVAEKVKKGYREARGTKTKALNPAVKQTVRQARAKKAPAKKAPEQKSKQYVLHYWMCERVSYATDNEQDIISTSEAKMKALGSSCGASGFWVESKNKKQKVHRYDIEGRGYDFSTIKKKYVLYNEYCDGIGSIEISTKNPRSIVPYEIEGGLIRSVRDENKKVWIIYAGFSFDGTINSYDSPEYIKQSLIYTGAFYQPGFCESGRFVPDSDYDAA